MNYATMTAGRSKGFTLIELMIVVAIIGVLAAVAYPSYISHLVKSRRADAQAHLMDIAQRQQQYLLDARSYAADLATLNMTTPPDLLKYYDPIGVVVVAGPPPTFTLTATPKTGSPQAGDVTLTLNSVGVKTPSDKW